MGVHKRVGLVVGWWLFENDCNDMIMFNLSY